VTYFDYTPEAGVSTDSVLL